MAWATALRKTDYPVSQGEVVVLPPSRSLNTQTAPKLAQKLFSPAGPWPGPGKPKAKS